MEFAHGSLGCTVPVATLLILLLVFLDKCVFGALHLLTALVVGDREQREVRCVPDEATTTNKNKDKNKNKNKQKKK